jgi:hypothetical protein
MDMVLNPTPLDGLDPPTLLSKRQLQQQAGSLSQKSELR